jgi:acetoacetyl-CoA synthetase
MNSVTTPPSHASVSFGSKLWEPSAQQRSNTNLARFADSVGRPLDYDSLHQWSVDDPGAFWSAVWEFGGIEGKPGPVNFQRGQNMRADQFFPGAKLNLATNLLRKRGNGLAIVAYDELGLRRTRTWDQLRAEVGAFAAGLKAEGVSAGDRVAAYLPHSVEAVVAMIATASLGATFSTASPDFGTAGVLDRFSQIDPVILLGCTEYSYGGKNFDTTERLNDIKDGLPSVRRTIIVAGKNDTYEAFIAPHRGADVPDDLYPYDQPWYVLYSSGTTGKPKCFVHRAGGVLLKHLQEQQVHCDFKEDDVVLYFTTTGWMMWNWLVSALASGCTIVCIDGSPFYPTPNRLFDVVDREGVTFLGVGAKYIDSLKKEGLRPRDTHELTSLRAMCSTGSPLSTESYAYVYDAIKTDLHLGSISGGTDLCGSFVGSDPTAPVFAGEIARPLLGMAVDVWDANANSTRLHPLERGELVCTQSFPSMPLGFWGDASGEKYSAAYFERFPQHDVWAHGDFAAWTEHGGFVIHGRSDSTLNPGGVRIGTAEIYRQVETLPEVVESLVFGQDWDDDSRIVLLVRMASGVTLTSELIADIKRRIRTNCSPRHTPALVLEVSDLPRTRSGKLTELAVADAVNGREVRNTEAMANPEALWAIAERAELQK